VGDKVGRQSEKEDSPGLSVIEVGREIGLSWCFQLGAFQDVTEAAGEMEGGGVVLGRTLTSAEWGTLTPALSRRTGEGNRPALVCERAEEIYCFAEVGFFDGAGFQG
jgi:hypothetical protein